MPLKYYQGCFFLGGWRRGIGRQKDGASQYYRLFDTWMQLATEVFCPQYPNYAFIQLLKQILPWLCILRRERGEEGLNTEQLSAWIPKHPTTESLWVWTYYIPVWNLNPSLMDYRTPTTPIVQWSYYIYLPCFKLSGKVPICI